MTKELIIIALIICLVYYYYQQNNQQKRINQLKINNEKLKEYNNNALEIIQQYKEQANQDQTKWQQENKLSQKTIQGLTVLAEKRKQDLAREKQALIDLAKQKIGNKKEAKELLKQLEQNWQEEKTEFVGAERHTRTEYIQLIRNYDNLINFNNSLNDLTESLHHRLQIQAEELEKSQRQTLQKDCAIKELKKQHTKEQQSLENKNQQLQTENKALNDDNKGLIHQLKKRKSNHD